jgi:hypothetical protein
MLLMTQASGRVGSRLRDLCGDAMDHHASGQCAAPVSSLINLNQWLADAAARLGTPRSATALAVPARAPDASQAPSGKLMRLLSPYYLPGPGLAALG